MLFFLDWGHELLHKQEKININSCKVCSDFSVNEFESGETTGTQVIKVFCFAGPR